MLYDISVNLISDAVFIGILLILSGVFWYWPVLSQARKFFGAGKLNEINIYISVHEDKQTTTRKVVTVEEYEAADYLRRTINRRLKDSVFGRIAEFLTGLLGFEPKIPETKIVADAFEDIELTGGAFVIGGPVRNEVTREALEKGKSWISYNEEKQKFQIVKGRRKGEFVDHSEKLSIVEKVKIDGRNFILAYGFGEMHTRAAVEYLAEKWRKLFKEFGTDAFAICLLPDDKGGLFISNRYSKSTKEETAIDEESVGR